MPRITERLDGGLINVRDPAVLTPGQLAFIRNAQYMPGDGALWRATGRVTAGTATADPSGVDVSGLRDAQFDNGTHLVIAHASSNYATAALADSMGTFGTLASGIGVGSSLEVVHYRNRFFLFNGTQSAASGIGQNRVVYMTGTGSTSPTHRQHGMVETTDSFTTGSSATAFSQAVTGYYEYWTTEVAHVTQDGADLSIESTFAGNPATIFVTALGMAPVITLGSIANPGFTTHWRVYRSPKKDKQSDKKFPTGFMIAEMGTATSSIVDGGGTQNTGLILCSSVNASPSAFSDFGNATELTADGGGTSATAVVQTSLAGLVRRQGVYNFNFGGFTGNIKGLEVQIKGKSTSYPIRVSCRVGRNRNPQDGGWLPSTVSAIPGSVRQTYIDAFMKVNTATKSALLTADNQVLSFGASDDRWFSPDILGFVDSDFGPNWMVEFDMNFSGTQATCSADYVKARVTYGSTVDSVIPFPTVAYNFGDITAQVGKNGKPPSSSTGDLFEDSLVVNDVSNPGLIRYSAPGDPEAFPSTYYLDFETPNNDRVTCIKVVNSRLIVMLRSSVYRVNYLPSERDASFDRGKAIEVISRNYGCVNEMCACTFTIDGSQERLAFVSDQGIYVTDGYNAVCWSDDLDWRGDRNVGLFAVSNSSGNYTPVALVNDPENQMISFLFRNSSLTSISGGDYWKLNFHYADMKGGRPRISGMVTMLNTVGGVSARPTSMWPIIRSGGTTEIFLGYGASGAGSTGAGAGQVWRETGTTIPSADPAMRFSMRRMYLAGYGKEWKLNEMYGYTGLQTWSGAPTVNYTATSRKTNTATVSQSTKSHTFTSSTERMHKVIFSKIGEAISVSAVVTGECVYAQEFVVIDGENFGLEDAGT